LRFPGRSAAYPLSGNQAIEPTAGRLPCSRRAAGGRRHQRGGQRRIGCTVGDDTTDRETVRRPGVQRERAGCEGTRRDQQGSENSAAVVFQVQNICRRAVDDFPDGERRPQIDGIVGGKSTDPAGKTPILSIFSVLPLSNQRSQIPGGAGNSGRIRGGGFQCAAALDLSQTSGRCNSSRDGGRADCDLDRAAIRDDRAGIEQLRRRADSDRQRVAGIGLKNAGIIGIAGHVVPLITVVPTLIVSELPPPICRIVP